MRDHFHERSRHHISTVVQQWKEDEVYPYDDGHSDEQGDAVRDLFDVIAVKAASAVNSNQRSGCKAFISQTIA